MENEDQVWACSCASAKAIVDAVNCLWDGAKKDAICDFEISADSMSVSTMNRARSIQSRLLIPSSVFEEYKLTGERSLKFSANFQLFVDCLLIYGSPAESLCYSFYFTTSDPVFKVSLDDGGVLTECHIRTFIQSETSESANLYSEFAVNDETCQMILKSDSFRDVLQDVIEFLDDATIVNVITSDNQRDKIGLQLLFESPEGRSRTNSVGCDVSFPRDSDAFVMCQVTRSDRWQYRLATFAAALKALAISSETCLKLNCVGELCVQHQIQRKGGDEVDLFIDSILLPIEP